jgi:crotonobetainyl-CoA:carnitine CoA-transferase CaiB-like acyl-CoA transferase
MFVNRGKRSITLDLKNAESRKVIADLVRCADVVVENFKPGVTARLGIDYGTLERINPRIVYASISGFGQDGPLSHRPAYDIIAQAMGGIMSINGNPGLPPTRVGESLGDIAAGLYASWAVLAALQGRNASGKGQHLDIAMVDSIFSLLVTALSQFLFTGKVPGRIGNAHPISAPLDSFRASDGYLIIAVANDGMFRRLADAIGKPGIATDPQFATDAERKRNEAALKDIIEQWTSARTVTEAVSCLEAASVPASPILSLAEIVASEHVAHRGLVTHIPHPTAGLIPLVPQPVQFLGTGTAPVKPPPLLGEHTVAILGQTLGYDDETIEQLQRRRVV